MKLNLKLTQLPVSPTTNQYRHTMTKYHFLPAGTALYWLSTNHCFPILTHYPASSPRNAQLCQLDLVCIVFWVWPRCWTLWCDTVFHIICWPLTRPYEVDTYRVSKSSLFAWPHILWHWNFDKLETEMLLPAHSCQTRHYIQWYSHFQNVNLVTILTIVCSLSMYVYKVTCLLAFWWKC